MDASLGSVLLLAVPVALLFASALLSTTTQNGLTLHPPISRASLSSRHRHAHVLRRLRGWPPSALALTWLVQLLKVLRCCSHQLAPASTYDLLGLGSSSMQYPFVELSWCCTACTCSCTHITSRGLPTCFCSGGWFSFGGGWLSFGGGWFSLGGAEAEAARGATGAATASSSSLPAERRFFCRAPPKGTCTAV